MSSRRASLAWRIGKQESDPRVRQQMETTLADQQRLQENIDELDNRMQRADLQLDSSLAALGTVYSQCCWSAATRWTATAPSACRPTSTARCRDCKTWWTRSTRSTITRRLGLANEENCQL